MTDPQIIIFKDYYYYPNYTISNTGVVTNIKKNRVLKQSIKFNGYLRINLSCNGKATNCEIHILVARFFVSNPNKYVLVEHINQNIYDNNYTNLRWIDSNLL